MHCCTAAWPRSAGSVRATSRIAVQAVAALVTDHYSTETEIGAGDFFHRCDSADRSNSTTKTAAYGTSDLVPNWGGGSSGQTLRVNDTGVRSAAEDHMDRPDFPTMEQVEKATREQLARWYRFLPSGDTKEQQKIQDRIAERFKELGGMTPELSKKIGF